MFNISRVNIAETAVKQPAAIVAIVTNSPQWAHGFDGGSPGSGAIQGGWEAVRR